MNLYKLCALLEFHKKIIKCVFYERILSIIIITIKFDDIVQISFTNENINKC